MGEGVCCCFDPFHVPRRVWQVLDAILRTTQPEMIAKHQDTDEGVLKPGSRLRS